MAETSISTNSYKVSPNSNAVNDFDFYFTLPCSSTFRAEGGCSVGGAAVCVQLNFIFYTLKKICCCKDARSILQSACREGVLKVFWEVLFTLALCVLLCGCANVFAMNMNNIDVGVV